MNKPKLWNGPISPAEYDSLTPYDLGIRDGSAAYANQNKRSYDDFYRLQGKYYREGFNTGIERAKEERLKKLLQQKK